MEEGFKKEQHARQQVQSEIVQGFKNEEKCETAGSKRAGFHEGRNQESENGQWQHCLQRGQYRSETGGLELLLGHHYFPLGGLKPSFQGRRNLKARSQMVQRVVFRELRTER